MNARIVEYSDPGDFLRALYLELKKTQPGLSHRYISATIGVKSPAVFSQIIKGKINPSPRVLDGLAKAFGLDPEARDRLALMFALRKIKDRSVRDIIISRIMHAA